MTWQPEDFDDLAAELRRRVEAEFRSEADEEERLVDLQRRRKATLRDIATIAMHQGQRVVLRALEAEWKGEVVAVGADYLSLQTALLLLDARLDSVAIAITPARQGGHTAKAASETFRARLTEFELTGERVTLRSRAPAVEVTGIIEVVAPDHVVVNCPGELCYLPLDGVFMVIRPLPD